ncbi:MAG: hypothetical protein IPJ41_04530 [Phycisphaerales bacterium]|nr:hypothetical protein [Phycisphaerales bacterium]
MKKYVAIGVVMCSLLGVGCSTESVFRSDRARTTSRVDVENAPDMVQVVASVTPTPRPESDISGLSRGRRRRGVRASLANNPGDVRSRFGPAVANEQMGNYAAAEAAYRKRFCKNVPEYEAGLARVRGRH